MNETVNHAAVADYYGLQQDGSAWLDEHTIITTRYCFWITTLCHPLHLYSWIYMVSCNVWSLIPLIWRCVRHLKGVARHFYLHLQPSQQTARKTTINMYCNKYRTLYCDLSSKMARCGDEAVDWLDVKRRLLFKLLCFVSCIYPARHYSQLSSRPFYIFV